MKQESSTGLAGSVFGLEQSEVGEGCGFGFEGGDGFDEAGDGEGVAHAAGTADQAEHAAFAGAPMVSRPWTSSTDTPPDWRTLISMGGRSVMAVGQTILIIERRWPFAMP